MSRHYILRDKLAIRCDDLLAWVLWFADADRTVARTDIDGIVVSTVFLGLDHQFGDGEPRLFETMIFIDAELTESIPFQQAQANDSIWLNARRDSFWGEAEQTHHQACDEVRRRIQQSKAIADTALANVQADEERMPMPWLDLGPT